MEWTKEKRSEYLENRLTDLGYPAWGRAAKIADLIGTSHSQATNWLNGAVPRDHDEIKRVADTLGLDIMEWVYGRCSEALNETKLAKAIAMTFELGEETPGEEFKPEHFAQVVLLVYTEKLQGAAVLESLALLSNIRKTGGVEQNGTNR